MIKWYIYLCRKSQSAYKAFRQSKCVMLPSQRTLRDYTHYVKGTAGFSAEVDLQLMQAVNIDKCEEQVKYIFLLLDEMYIREDLVYDKNTDMIIGFVNLGEINTHLLAFERSLSESDSSTSSLYPPLASTMMSFMVRGLFNSLQHPYAQFPCHQVKGDLLFQPFWGAVLRLERCGFKVTMNIDNKHLFNLSSYIYFY